MTKNDAGTREAGGLQEDGDHPDMRLGPPFGLEVAKRLPAGFYIVVLISATASVAWANAPVLIAICRLAGLPPAMVILNVIGWPVLMTMSTVAHTHPKARGAAREHRGLDGWIVWAMGPVLLVGYVAALRTYVTSAPEEYLGLRLPAAMIVGAAVPTAVIALLAVSLASSLRSQRGRCAPTGPGGSTSPETHYATDANETRSCRRHCSPDAHE